MCFIAYFRLECLQHGVHNHVHEVARPVDLIRQILVVVVVVVVVVPQCAGDVNGDGRDFFVGRAVGVVATAAAPIGGGGGGVHVVIAANAGTCVILKLQLMREGSNILKDVLNVI